MTGALDMGIVAVVQRLSLCRDRDAVLAVLREAVRELTGADGATVTLREGDFCHYAEENAIEPLWKGRRFAVNTCISGTCMSTRRQIAIEDIYADPRVPHDLYRPTFVKSLVVTPIRSMEPMGAIGAYWAERHEATGEELATLQALADAAAVAFENAALIASLVNANRRKDEFMLMLAHELRNPLAPTLNAAHLLRATTDLDARGAWAVEVIERQVDHLARMTDELLDTSRIVSGKVRLKNERLDLARLLRDVVDDRRAAARAAALALDAAVPETPLWVQGDATRLTQVLANLLDNAVKFTPGGGRIDVVLVAEGAEAVVRLRDNGVGIDPAFLPHVFESFAQEDKSLERARGGLGLGLTIARTLARAQGGDLEAASAGAGRGTEMTLRLPLAPTLAATTVPGAGIKPVAATAPLSILVVEDNADAADSLRMLLELGGHSVTVARDGLAGVEAARTRPPDVVLCDIGLPGLDGYQVARALREDPVTADARLIAVTGYGNDDAHERTVEAGFDEHLTKPVAPETLLAALDSGGARRASARRKADSDAR